MDEIRISLKKSIDDSYSIYLGTGIFKSQINAEIGRLSPSKITVITDSNLYKRYAGILESSIEFADKQIIQYPAGEENKNIGTLMQCFDAMLSFGMDRKSLVIAFGGGVTGDMAGLLAAVYMRGVNLIQVPTSVIAMVDSSIGGKTAIDVPLGKNLFGIFYQPKTVIIDVDFLKTLPEPEYINGLAEAIKHGIVKDFDYFDLIQKNAKRVLSRDPKLTLSVILQSCRIKQSVVEADEKEKGMRKILNFGHTIGHAIEAASEYTIPHGFAVAWGMIAEASISMNNGILAEKDYELLINTLQNLNLLQYRDKLKQLDIGKMQEVLSYDKKNEDGVIYIVVLKQIGEVISKENRYAFPIENLEIGNIIGEILK